ncbi:transposase [Vibrio astriarenae]
MTTARKKLVDTNITPYYHCVSRCVRQSFLCGHDKTSGRSYEHRKKWVENRINLLTKVYCIDVCAYAVMSNHYHLVVFIDKAGAEELTPYEVVNRWALGHKIPDMVKRWQTGTVETPAELKACNRLIETWRIRLCDLGWFMKELNYDIARKANEEDDCKGHFWESRYKSQALLDESALIAAMAYVDLNPVRAGVSKNALASDFTSIKRRVIALENNQDTAPNLAVFVGRNQQKVKKGIPFTLADYIELLGWSSTQHRQGKTSIQRDTPNALGSLNLEQSNWLAAVTLIERKRAKFVGLRSSLDKQRGKMSISRVNGEKLDVL